MGESAVEPDLRRILAQQPRADGMKGARPGESVCKPCLAAQGVCRDALDAPSHLGRGAAREGQQHDASRIDSANDEMRHTVRQRVGLARAGTGYDQERRRAGDVRAAELNGAALFRIEMGEMRGGHRDGRVGRGASSRAHAHCHARARARPLVRIIEFMPAAPRLNP